MRVVGRYNSETQFIEVTEYVNDLRRTTQCVVIDTTRSFNKTKDYCGIIGYTEYENEIVSIRLENMEEDIPVICPIDDVVYTDIPSIGQTYRQDNLILPHENIDTNELKEGSVFRIQKFYGEETVGIIAIDMGTRILHVFLDGRDEPAYILDRWGV